MSTAVAEWLDLEVPERMVFAHSPLVLVLGQVKFSPTLSVTNPTAVAPFQEAIIDQYPVATPLQQQNVRFQLEGGPDHNKASVQSIPGGRNWQFSDFDSKWTVVLTPEFMTLETRAYSDFSEFEDRFEKLLGVLDKTIHPTVGTRVGLRYVNEIRLPGDGWRTAIRPELLGLLAVPSFGDLAVQSFQQMSFHQPDGVRIVMHHGMFPNGTAIDPPAEDVALDLPFYLLDIDVAQEFRPGELSMKPRVVREQMRQFHDLGSRLFRWAVTEHYLAGLERA